jgi:predicted acyl esterase
MAQIAAAKLRPPHLKAIFAMDPGAQYYQDQLPGGVIGSFITLPGIVSAQHITTGQPGPLPPEKEAMWQEAMQNPDYLMYPQVYNIVDMKGQVSPRGFEIFINPYNKEGEEKKVDDDIKNINIPVYTGSGWYAFTYKFHLLGAQSLWTRMNDLKMDIPRKLMFCGPAHMQRPFHQYANEVVRWYDYWIKGVKNGIMDDPKVKFWVEGAEKWLAADDWPVPNTTWKKFYLHTWERLRTEPFPAHSRESHDVPDTFVQMPPTHTNKIQKLRYLTDPLPKDTLVAGPMSLTLYASIDQPDTYWIVVLKDVGPDVGRRTARAEEREIPENLPEKELTRGWLKASHRAIDTERSTPGRPWHPRTRKAVQPVEPGGIVEYQIDILPNANMFRRGHRICIEITSLDLPTGTAGYTDVEYIPYHICSSKTTVHNIYHSHKYPSHLLLPIIPADTQSWLE